MMLSFLNRGVVCWLLGMGYVVVVDFKEVLLLGGGDCWLYSFVAAHRSVILHTECVVRTIHRTALVVWIGWDSMSIVQGGMCI